MNLQFSESLTDPAPGQSRFAALGGANDGNDFDSGLQGVFGAGLQSAIASR